MELTALINLISGVVNRIWPDKTEAQKQQFLLEIQQQLNQTELAKGQLQINAEEAKHQSLFVAGPRPFIMWGLGGCLVLYYLLVTVTNFAIAWGFNAVVMPPLDPMIRDIVLGLLGLGWISRSYEKAKGVANK